MTVDQNATNASNNPLTPKVTLLLQNYFMPLVMGQDGRASDEVLARLYVPFDLDGTQNSLRIYVPLDTAPTESTSGRGAVRLGRHGQIFTVPGGALGEGSSVFGFGDIMAYDLIMHEIGKFDFGIGPLVVLPTATHPNLGRGTWQAGPAAVVVRRWGWGLTGAAVTYSHSFAGPGKSVQALGVEPHLFYNLDNGLYLRSTGIWNLAFGTEPSYIPIGFGIGKVWTLPSGATLNLHFEPGLIVQF